MLCEASSVTKAIKTAWQQAGKPSEFSIKILETGEKGFLWFTKHPAIVSISYDPRKQTEQTVEKQIQPIIGRKQQLPQPSQSTAQDALRKKQHPRKGETPASNVAPQKSQLRELRGQPNIASAHTQQQPQKQQASQHQTQSPRPLGLDAAPSIIWADEQVSDISQWLQETLVLLESESKFTATIDKKNLRIVVDQPIIPGAEESKSLYISLSNLFMQALKKKNKKKFHGLSIIITIKGATHNGHQKANTAE